MLGYGLCYTFNQTLHYDNTWELCKGRPFDRHVASLLLCKACFCTCFSILMSYFTEVMKSTDYASLALVVLFWVMIQWLWALLELTHGEELHLPLVSHQIFLLETKLFITVQFWIMKQLLTNIAI